MVSKKSSREEEMVALNRDALDKGQRVTTVQTVDLICCHYFLLISEIFSNFICPSPHEVLGENIQNI